MKKRCTKCKRSKPIDDFSWRKINIRRHAACKICYRKILKKHYKANKDQYLKRNKIKYEKIMQMIVDYLLKTPCIDCGEKDIVSLDFDHKDAESKRLSVIRLAKYGWRRVREEMEKCVVRCATCHRKRTAKQFKWKYKVLGAIAQ